MWTASCRRAALLATLLPLLVPLSWAALSAETRKDLLPECDAWAERGDCKPSGRPFFMQKNCAAACHKKMYRDPEHRNLSEDDRDRFYDLSAETATGKVLALEDFEGYVTVLVNAARACEQARIFYDTLEHMHSINPYALEILAFPVEHPDIDIQSCRAEVLASEKKAGRKIHVMAATEFNGPAAHPVYQYLKRLFDTEELDPHVAHYFFVDPDVTTIEHHHGASYKTLKMFVDVHVKALEDKEL